MTFAPVVVVESGGLPFTQVAEGVDAPPFTVVESGAFAITLVESGGAPIALFNPDGTPYTGVSLLPLFSANLVDEAYYVDRAEADFATAFDYARTGSALAVKADGTYQSFAANEARLTDAGLTLEVASANHVLHTSPAAIPGNGWDGFNGSGVSRQVVGTGTEFGLPYVDIRWWTPTTASSTGTNMNFATATQITVAQGEVWTESLFARLVAGSLATIGTMRLILSEYTDAGVKVGATHYQSPTMSDVGIDATLQRYDMTVTMDRGATAVRGRPGLEFTYASGAAFDFTIRLYNVQFEKQPEVTSPIPTTGSTATRAADVLTAKLPAGVTADLIFTHDDLSTTPIASVPAGNYALDPADLARPLVTRIDWGTV